MQSQSRPIVLIVEDEFLIALALATVFEDEGISVLGPADSVQTALRLIENAGKIDAAVLDVNLRGVLVLPVADALLVRRVPFIFVTGYTDMPNSPKYKTIRRFTKPADSQEVVSTILALAASA